MSFCFCRLAVRRSKKNCIHSPVRLNRSKNIASIHPFDFTVRKKLHLFTRSTLPFEKMLHPFSRSTDVSNGLSSRLLSVRFAVRSAVRTDNAVLYIHLKAKRWYLQCTREKRETSREKRDSSREKRDASREKRDASRETVVTYI